MFVHTEKQRLQISAQVIQSSQESLVGQTDDGSWDGWLYPQRNWAIHVRLLQQYDTKIVQHNVLK